MAAANAAPRGGNTEAELFAADRKGAILAGIAGLAVGAICAALTVFLWTHQASQAYAIAAGQGSTVWRLDTRTGKLSMCYIQSVDSYPTCSPSGPLSGAELRAEAERIMSELAAKAAAASRK